MKFIKNQKGYVVSIITFFVLIIMLSMALSMSFLTADRQRKITNIVKSTQSYYAAEAGVEDAMIRLKKNPQMSPITYNLSVNNATTTVDIPSTIGASKSITSQATNTGNTMRKVQAVVSISNGYNTSFYYGINVGAGGLVMEGGTRVQGNVFSSGNITGTTGTIIDNDVVVSGNGHSISGGLRVKGNARAYSCLSTVVIDGNLTYVTGGTRTCTVRGTTSTQSQEISEEPMPIPQSQVTAWKNEATGGGTVLYNGNYSLSGVGTATLIGPGVINGSVTLSNSAVLTTGPIKITGNLTINGAAKLKMKGILYVQGNIILNNSGQVYLDTTTYGSSGGIIIADGTINTGGAGTFKSTGQTGSYVLVLSNSTSTSAITVANSSSTGAAFYTTAGTLNLSGAVSLVEATGYRVKMTGSANIQYSSGLVNIYFSSGPGGGWKASSWQEY